MRDHEIILDTVVSCDEGDEELDGQPTKVFRIAYQLLFQNFKKTRQEGRNLALALAYDD